MIRDLLPTDAEHAQEMLRHSHSEEEILAALLARGVDREKAVKLLDDLRHGRAPDVHLHYTLGSSATTPAPVTASGARQPLQAEAPAHYHHRHRRRKSIHAGWWAIPLSIIFLWALWYAFFKTGGEGSRDALDAEKHAIPPSPTKNVAP
jgi:hypothetical protein